SRQRPIELLSTGLPSIPTTRTSRLRSPAAAAGGSPAKTIDGPSSTISTVTDNPGHEDIGSALHPVGGRDPRSAGIVPAAVLLPPSSQPYHVAPRADWSKFPGELGSDGAGPRPAARDFRTHRGPGPGRSPCRRRPPSGGTRGAIGAA